MYKYRFFSVLNITGLAIGMAASIMILSWTGFHMSFDRNYENHENIYRVVQHIKFEQDVTWAITQGPLGEAITNETPGVKNFCRMRGANLAFKTDDNNEFRESTLIADPSFIDIFTINCTLKNKDNPLSSPDDIVISESLATKLFGEENPIGKQIEIPRLKSLTVSGVFPDIPKNSHIQYDVLVHFKLLEEFGAEVEIWNNSGYYTYLLLDESANPKDVRQQIENFLDDKPTLEEGTVLDIQKLTDIHRTTDLDFENASVVSNTYIKLFLIIGVFILLLACINYINLDTAKASKRSKEIGIKKITGAKSGLLRSQFLGEAWILSFIAIFIAIILIGLCKPLFQQLTGIDIQFDLKKFSTYIYLIALWAITGLLAGGYPALYLAKIKPISIMNGRGLSAKSGSSLRTLLVIFQFCLAILFIIGTLTIYRQISHMKTADLGYDRENIVFFYASQDLQSSYESLEEKLMNNPNIESVCLSSAPLDNMYNFSNSLWHWPGQDPDKQTLFRCVNIGFNFFETHGMEIVEGRAPSEDMQTDSAFSIVINEAAAKMMNLENTVDTRIRYGNSNTAVNIIGVVKDFHFRSLHQEIEPQILIIRPSACNIVTCRLNGFNIAQTKEQIAEIANDIVAGDPIRMLHLNDILENAYQDDKTTGRLLILFTSLSILVSILGLIGLMAFVSEQRIPEIGIRKTLGASNRSILKLFTWQYMRLILLSIVISWPVAYFGIQIFLQHYPNRINMPYLDFALAGAIAIVFVQITLTIVSLKTSRKAAVTCLRHY